MGNKLSMSRRTFMKTAVIAGTATAMSSAITGTALADGSPEDAAKAGEVTKIRSACRGCGKMECGVWVYVKDGKVIKPDTWEDPAPKIRACIDAVIARKGK